jgi:hypothetical protein
MTAGELWVILINASAIAEISRQFSKRTVLSPLLVAIARTGGRPTMQLPSSGIGSSAG